MTKSKIALSKINALSSVRDALLPTIEPNVALSEVERAEEKNTPGTPESALQRDDKIVCPVTSSKKISTKLEKFSSSHVWGAHAPSRAGEGASPSCTCSRIEIFGEGAENSTRGRVRSPPQKICVNLRNLRTKKSAWGVCVRGHIETVCRKATGTPIIPQPCHARFASSSPICSMPDFEWCLAAKDRIASSGTIVSLAPSFSVEKTAMMRFLTKSDRCGKP